MGRAGVLQEVRVMRFAEVVGEPDGRGTLRLRVGIIDLLECDECDGSITVLLARELLRNFPKGKGKRSSRRRRKKGEFPPAQTWS